MRGILFDLDGVFYVGDQAIPGGRETLDWVRAQHIPHCFLTNTSSRPRSALVAKLTTYGISIKEEEILTPPVAAARWIQANINGATALFVPEATRSEFADLTVSSPNGQNEVGAEVVGAVVIGDLGEAWDYPTLNSAFRLLMQDPHPALIALGMTRYWRATDGLRLDVAPFIVALKHATDIEPVILGKPARKFFEIALSMVGCDAVDTIMVGDDIRGDVKAAQDAGILGVQVRTGKFQESDLTGEIKPDATLGSIAELPIWWQDQSAC